MISDVNMSCDGHVVIPCFMVSIVVELTALYGEDWLAWLPDVYNHNLPVSLLVCLKRSIVQVLSPYTVPYVVH